RNQGHFWTFLGGLPGRQVDLPQPSILFEEAFPLSTLQLAQLEERVPLGLDLIERVRDAARLPGINHFQLGENRVLKVLEEGSSVLRMEQGGAPDLHAVKVQKTSTKINCGIESSQESCTFFA